MKCPSACRNTGAVQFNLGGNLLLFSFLFCILRFVFWVYLCVCVRACVRACRGVWGGMCVCGGLGGGPALSVLRFTKQLYNIQRLK